MSSKFSNSIISITRRHERTKSGDHFRLQSEIKREKMSSATPRRHLSKDDKLAIIEASKSPGFSKEEAMKKWGIRRTQMYDLLKNKKVSPKITVTKVWFAKI